MTLQELEKMDKEFLTPDEVSKVIGCKPHSIRVQVGIDPTALGFPVTKIGTRVLIPRRGFISWMKGEQYGR